jgi:hypothetical protein
VGDLRGQETCTFDTVVVTWRPGKVPEVMIIIELPMA